MDGYKFLQNEEIYQAIFDKHLTEAKKSVLIATANVKNIFIKRGREYVSIVQIFKELCKRDIYVGLLFAAEPSRSFLDEIHKQKLNNNQNFFWTKCIRVHFKCVIIDERIAYTGSANLTGAGIGVKSKFKRNFEMGFMTTDRKVIKSITQTFSNITEKKECRDCKRKELCSDFQLGEDYAAQKFQKQSQK